MFQRLLVVLLLFSLTVSPAIAQEKPAKVKAEDVDAEAEQRQEVAMALVVTLADEARSFKDQTRRARVQARAADILWERDQERARELFKRAWESAETADTDAARQRAEDIKRMQAAGEPIVLRCGPELRNEVLRIVAKRDQGLAEEFLKAFDEAKAKASEETAEVDLVRAWETLAEVIKAANAADAFTGEDSRIFSRIQTKEMTVINQSTAEDFDLLGLFRQLARADLLRAVQLTKSFTGYVPRAVATLAIAQSVLEKRKDRA